MFLDKKGILPTLVLMFTLLCFGAAIFFFSEAMDNQKGYVGQAQLDFSNALVESENSLIYDEQVLKQSFGDLVVDFASKGGVSDNSGTFDNFNYWEKGGVKCYPNVIDLERNFVLFLDNAMVKGDYDTDLVFKQGGGMEVKLTSLKNYTVSGSNYEIKYIPNAEIIYGSDYDFSLFLENIDKVKAIVEECGEDLGCWGTKADFYWEEDNKLYKFKLVSGKITDAFGEKEVILNAAVDFNELNALTGDEFKCSG